MKKETFEKGSFYFNMFGEYYTMMKSLLNGDANGERPDAYWEKVVADIDQFYNKYRCDYAKDLVISLTNELERRGKIEQKEKEQILSA